MHLHTSTLTSLLILSTNALPQKPQDLLDPSPRHPDNSGPTKQTPPLSPSKPCDSAPLVVPQPSAVGIYGAPLPDNFPSSHTTNWLSCTATATQICATMSMPNTLAGRWYFNSSILPSQTRPSDSRSACQIGVWLPRDDIGPVKSESSDPNAARKPSLEQCQRTLNATIDAAKYSQPLWVNASINLVKEPENVEGQWKIGQEDGAEISTGKHHFPPSVRGS
ncbi:MAG: hypothetical protein L6R42_005345 [Xanthoria sp. 1 TBL-2021]|nr:MAG: hypothetical protein L6R42_005345 [Xanthoria sp. 1 TBL-2021]